MSRDRTVEDLDRAAAAAGFSMASVEDDNYVSTSGTGDAVARGARNPTASEALRALPAPSARRATVDSSRGFIAGANTVRDTVYGYLGLGATA